MLFPFMWDQNACIFSRILLTKQCFVASFISVYCLPFSVQVLEKNETAHAKRFDWPKNDDFDRVHITCVFLGPVHLKGMAHLK